MVGVANGQLAATPFAGARLSADDTKNIERTIEGVIDESAVWQGMQRISRVLAIFRERYTPKAGSPIIDAGDPQDNDSQGRRADIGAIDSDGHDQDKLGKFGTPPSEIVPPTVTLTAPSAGATLTGTATVLGDRHGQRGRQRRRAGAVPGRRRRGGAERDEPLYGDLQQRRRSSTAATPFRRGPGTPPATPRSRRR